MGFFGGASGKEKKAYGAAAQTAQDRFGGSSDWATGQRDHLSQFGNDIRQRGTERGAHMWDQLWGEGGAFAGGGGGGGGGGGYRGDPNSIWGELRDTGDLSGGDWGKARETYEDFRTTGGWDDDSKRDFRARAIAGTDMYDPRADAASRVQGGWGAGTSGSELARQKAISEMRRRGSFDAETELARSLREGQRWGASSLEGLGTKVGAGRERGQSQLDAERQRRAAARRSAAAGRRADQNALWGRSMQLMGFDQSRLGQGGADLQYDAAAQNAARGGFGAADQAYGRQQQNKGWGSQIAGLAGAGVGAATGLGWSPLAPSAPKSAAPVY